MRLNSSNPALKGNILHRATINTASEIKSMSINGAIDKTSMLLAILLLTGGATFSYLNSTSGLDYASPFLYPAIIGGGISAFIIALISIYKPHTSPICAPIYAALEGVFLGAISSLPFYGDFAFSAMFITACILGTMLFLYRAKIIVADQKFKAGLMTATIGAFVIIICSFFMSMFGMLPAIYDFGLIGIGFSLFMLGLASCYLILDFDLIENMIQSGAPKYMEWYAGFTIMITLVWIYLEALRLISILNRD